ncbi:hypothetical protein DFH06DRAFT_1269160 [Mycena polygramma]|nr:hypothetical protein DFH06DRAFT_1269160 [Mycena polygramma]
MAYSDGFAWTPSLVNLSNELWSITAMIGAVFCGVVLLVIGVVALNPVCRPHLDRVSFRILVWALAANTVFGITNAIGGKFTGPTWTCGLDIWLLQLTLELSSFLLFAIALNLQLVVVHQVNGQKMEKYYIWGSIAIALGLTVPAYASKQYGWDPLVEDCWYANPDQTQRLAWQIGTQLFWSMLAVIGEVVCTAVVVVYMVRHQVQSFVTPTQIRMTHLSQLRRNRLGTTSGTRSRSGSMGSAANIQISHANAYRGIIFRIIVYPIASAIFNLISVVCVIHATQNDGVHNWTDYRVLLLSDFVYGGRSIMYALLAATDPVRIPAISPLMRAVRAFIQHSRGTFPSTQSTMRSATESKGTLSVHIELSTIRQNDSGVIVGDRASKYAHDDQFDGARKSTADIEASPRPGIILPGLPLDERNRLSQRLHEDRVRVRRQHENQEREAFCRQI